MDEEDWRIIQKESNELDLEITKALIKYPFETSVARMAHILHKMCDSYYGRGEGLLVAIKLLTVVSVSKIEKMEPEDD